MGRLPFDPDRMKKNQAASARTDEAMSVSAFSRMIERTVSDQFPKKIAVRGEVSGTRHRTHFYFNLKDEGAVIAAIMFASAAKRSAARPLDGRTVVASGKLEYYAPQGRLSLIVDSLVEDGQGSLEARFRALCDEFRARGWFDPDAKKMIPPFPGRIAVLTAAGSAALHDVLDTARQRCPAVDLLLIDIPVQGERAATTIVRTIRAVEAASRRLGIDAILLTRGGGSVEDLWCFNDPALAEAIHRCAVPIVAAIGHESDTTIAELVADHRSATPTQAVVRLTPDRSSLALQLTSLGRRGTRAIDQRISSERERVERLARRPVMTDPSAILAIQRRGLDHLEDRLRGSMQARIGQAQREVATQEVRLAHHRPHAELRRRGDAVARLTRGLHAAVRHRTDSSRRAIDGLANLLHAVDPTAVLDRGYSITTREDGSVVRDASRVVPGERLVSRVASGQVSSVVESAGSAARPSNQSEKKPAPEPAGGSAAAAARRGPRADDQAPGPPQMDLFGGAG